MFGPPRTLHSRIEDRREGFLPPPRGDAPYGPGYGESLKGELARGFALPDAAFPGYPPPGAGGAGTLKGGGGLAKPGYCRHHARLLAFHLTCQNR